MGFVRWIGILAVAWISMTLPPVLAGEPAGTPVLLAYTDEYGRREEEARREEERRTELRREEQRHEEEQAQRERDERARVRQRKQDAARHAFEQY